MTLADVLAPITLDDFMRDYLGERYVVIKGKTGRFHPLLSWQELDETLSRLRVNDDRVYLVRNGQKVPSDSYVQTSQSGRIQYLIGPALTRHVSDGASLVVNQVDEIFPAIRALAESCERVLQIYVAGNLYAGWRRDKGFDVHWDSHDTLIVQVHGRKEWRVWRPTRLSPIGGDGRDIVPPPSEEPVWEGTLEDGDTLYMPRGWWHVACPLDEPSVHVTLGLNHKTGHDLLGWLVEQARNSPIVRMNVPHWKSRDVQRSWIRSVRDACDDILNDDTVEAFMTTLSARAHTRPFVRLPRDGAWSQVSVDAQTPLRLVRGSRLRLRQNGPSVVQFEVYGKQWQCAAALAPALSLLTHNDPSTIAEMKQMIDERSQPLLRPIITALLNANVVWAEYHRDDLVSPAEVRV